MNQSRIFCLLFLLFFIKSNSQVFIPSYNNVANQVSQANILSNLTAFESFGVKYRGTSAQVNTLAWLRAQYLSYGYTEAQIVEDSFSYSGSTCKNLIVTKTGTLYPNTFVIIDGHYDTVSGPGTNDNGSGVSVILEIARLLQNIPTDYSIKFINFSGEEDGLIGSQHYVDNVVNSTTPKMDIRLVLNLDQIGGVAGMTNNTITCERDTSPPITNNTASNSMTNQLANCMELYSPLQTTIASAYGSDYVPFENNGEIITGLYETNESPFSHTANDLLVNMDPVYVYNIAKGATGAMLHFAVACTTCNLGSETPDVDTFSIYPNPADGQVTISMGDDSAILSRVRLFDMLGQLILEKNFEGTANSASVDISAIATGVYIAVVEATDKHYLQKLSIK